VSRSAVPAAPEFTLLSRADCHLCETMLEELRSLLGARAARVTVVDVDGDQELRRRFGSKVPVLLLEGEVVCYGHVDRAEVERLTRKPPPRP